MAASADRRLVAGRYALGPPLGRGGMGVVWRAEDVLLGRQVAVKEVQLPAARLAEDGPGLPEREQAAVRERALREARAAARLNHPGVVTLHDVVEAGGHLFLVMELVDAPTLRDLVEGRGPLDPPGAARLGLQLLDALEAAHRSGIVHHDVKPANVMVPAAAPAKLADFGIASLEDTQRTLTGAAFGSLPYVAPEQATGRRGGPAADLWALGATLWFAVEGAPPFRRDGPAATLAAILHDPPGEQRRAGPLGPVLLALLAKDPERRPAEAAVRGLLAPLAGPLPGATVPLRPTARLPADPAAPTELLAGDAAPPPAWRPPPPSPPAGWSQPPPGSPGGGQAPSGPSGWGQAPPGSPGAPPGSGQPPTAPAGAPAGWGQAPPGPPGTRSGRSGGAGRPRRRRGRRVLVVAGALVGVLLLGSLLDARDRPARQGPAAGRDRAAAAAGLGQPVRDGQFEFVVRSVRCGLRQVGPALARQTPQGRFCVLTVRVANVGEDARNFSAGDQRLFGADGRRHSVHLAATAANGSPQLLHTLVNPGNRIAGTLVYDVPARMRPARIELHDSPLSRGATVNLR
jgi:eukaryotic-like serine/threonine-protein kinase